MQRTARTLFWAMNVLQGIAQAACSEFMPSFYLNPRIIEINLQRTTHKIGFIQLKIRFTENGMSPNEGLIPEICH